MQRMSPWLSMWSQPRKTIRSIIESNPSYGVFYLATLFTLQEFFFVANLWSLGLRIPFWVILFSGLIFSPVVGMIWLYFAGWVFRVTGSIFKGKAPQSYLRCAIAWSKVPMTVTLFMWLVLMIIHPETVFIQDVGNPSSVFVNFINLILDIWAFVLLIQGVREVQKFSVGRAIGSVVIANLFLFLITFIIVGLFRYFI